MPPPTVRPPFDEGFAQFLEAFPTHDISLETLLALREALNKADTLEAVITGEPFTHTERTVPSPAGPVTLSIFYPKDDVLPASGPRPAIYHIHGGGMICANRFSMAKQPLRCAAAAGAIFVTVEYRLAPEHPFPAGMEDCWTGLKWVYTYASYLGIDPKRIMVSGQSAGGNLAAAMALRARDTPNGPRLCAQLIDCPMLDDRMQTTSSHQHAREGTWTRGSNITAWKALLGDKVGKPDVSPLASVTRAKKLAGLPPTYVSVGGSELFRDESVEYALRLWQAGVPTELHVWPGGFHGFDYLAPDVPVSKASLETRTTWVKRMLELPGAAKSKI